MQLAILIAVEEYGDEQISPIKFAENDVEQFAAAIKQIGFEDQEMLVSGQASRTKIRSRLKKLVGPLTEDDSLLLYYAGHGFSHAGRNYITCSDSQLDDLCDTSLELQWLFDLFSNTSCNRLALFLDSCASALLVDDELQASFDELDETELGEFFNSREHCVCFTSCAPGELSWPSGIESHGAWAYNVIQALIGNASTALDDASVMTAATLQNHLSQAVQKTLREAYTTAKDQTPCLFAANPEEFVLADLTEILATKQRASNSNTSLLLNMTFSGEQAVHVKSLSGFKKHHRVPDSISGTSATFVAEISVAEFNQVVDERFKALKEGFKLKRKGISVSNPGDGTATIITPYFNYSFSISLDPNDPSSALWRHAVDAIKEPDQILSDAFAEVFANDFDRVEFFPETLVVLDDLIDRIEMLDDERISVEYDQNATWCKLKVEGLTGIIEVTEGTVAIAKSRPELPASLLATFFSIQKALVDTHDVREITFDTSARLT